MFSWLTLKTQLKHSRGIASLPTVLALTILITAVVLVVSSLSVSESVVANHQKKSTQALLYAEAGARDALQRIARDKTYTCATENCYSLDMVTGGCASNDGCARVSVSAGVGSSASPKIITASGQVKTNTRKIQVTVEYDTELFGAVSSTTWTELTN